MGDIQECNNYRGIKLLTHTFKIWERVLDIQVNRHPWKPVWVHAREEHHRRYLHSQADDRAVSRGTEGHLCNLHRPREGLRPSPEGGDLENHEGEAGTRKICQAGPRHVHWMLNEGTHSRGRKQQIQC